MATIDAPAAVLAGYEEPARRLIALAQRLVRTPSITGEEGEVSRLVAAELHTLGYRDIEIDSYGNVIARFGPEPCRLLFNGHLDHVDPAGMDDPYGGAIVDGARWGVKGPVLRGRGSCDMKANVAAGAYAVAHLDESELERGYLFVADVQEETDAYEGVQSVLDRGVRAELGLSGESTGLAVALGHRGKLQLDARVTGRSSHASRPGDGVNAVYQAVPIVQALERAGDDLPDDPLYGKATISITRIDSEPREDVAVVPSACTIRIDRRYVPAETPDEVERELRELVAAVADRHGIEVEVSRVNHYPLMAIDPEHELVGAGVESGREVTGTEPELRAWRFGVNATFMSAAGIPSIGIGPGDERWAHDPEEQVPLADLDAASRIYARLIQRLCGRR